MELVLEDKGLGKCLGIFTALEQELKWSNDVKSEQTFQKTRGFFPSISWLILDQEV